MGKKRKKISTYTFFQRLKVDIITESGQSMDSFPKHFKKQEEEQTYGTKKVWQIFLTAK